MSYIKNLDKKIYSVDYPERFTKGNDDTWYVIILSIKSYRHTTDIT